MYVLLHSCSLVHQQELTTEQSQRAKRGATRPQMCRADPETSNTPAQLQRGGLQLQEYIREYIREGLQRIQEPVMASTCPDTKSGQTGQSAQCKTKCKKANKRHRLQSAGSRSGTASCQAAGRSTPGILNKKVTHAANKDNKISDAIDKP